VVELELELELSVRAPNTGFHSVGSRSDLPSWMVAGILMDGTGVEEEMTVGVMGATMVRGERGGGVGGEEVEE
jgi:hypothetical protein